MREYTISEDDIKNGLGSIEKLNERGIHCSAKFGQKGCISYDDCLKCEASIRCIAAEIIKTRGVRQDNAYYSAVPNVFHVTTAVYCLRKFAIERWLGVYTDPESVWRMMFGTVFHSEFEKQSVTKTDSEVSFGDVSFDTSFGKLSVRGSSDIYYDILPYDDFEVPIKDMCRRHNINSLKLQDFGGVRNVLEERKFTGTLKYILDSPSPHHETQVGYYIALMNRVKKPVHFEMYSYTDRFTGKTYRFLRPVIVNQDDKYEFGDVQGVRVIDTQKDEEEIKTRLEILQRTIIEPYAASMETKLHSAECNWCTFKNVCLKGCNGNEVSGVEELTAFLKICAKARDMQ